MAFVTFFYHHIDRLVSAFWIVNLRLNDLLTNLPPDSYRDNQLTKIILFFSRKRPWLIGGWLGVDRGLVGGW